MARPVSSSMQSVELEKILLEFNKQCQTGKDKPNIWKMYNQNQINLNDNKDNEDKQKQFELELDNQFKNNQGRYDQFLNALNSVSNNQLFEQKGGKLLDENDKKQTTEYFFEPYKFHPNNRMGAELNFRKNLLQSTRHVE